jgi:hypothetical protein
MPGTGKSKKSAVLTKGKLPPIQSVRASGETEKGLGRNNFSMKNPDKIASKQQ